MKDLSGLLEFYIFVDFVGYSYIHEDSDSAL